MNFSSISLIIYLLSFSTILFAQEEVLHIISGVVIDNDSKKPIPYVNVFLDATTLGASTNNNGEYKIFNIPRGSYIIIASAIGFNRESEIIQINSSETLKIDFNLKPIVYKLNEVSVIAEKDDEWASNMNLFKREFLGTSENAKHCKILNPEVLTFTSNKEIKLKAMASEPIKIINNALGYKIFFDIKEFILFKNREFNYHGNIRFVELKAKSVPDIEEWISNRDEIYKGSFRHFLISLSGNMLLENGFQIFLVNEPNWDDLRRRNFTMPEVSKIVKKVSNYENELEFYSNLMIVYDEWEEIGFQKYRNIMGSNIYKALKFQTSWLNLPYSSATFDINGNIVDDYKSTKFFGYWAWQRVAELLPNNYEIKFKEE